MSKAVKKVFGDVSSGLGITEGTTEKAVRQGAQASASAAVSQANASKIEEAERTASQERLLQGLVSERRAAGGGRRKAKGRLSNIFAQSEEGSIFSRALSNVLGN